MRVYRRKRKNVWTEKAPKHRAAARKGWRRKSRNPRRGRSPYMAFAARMWKTHRSKLMSMPFASRGLGSQYKKRA